MNQLEIDNRVSSPEFDALARRWKVLQVGKFYPPHMGGIETHLQTLCKELRERVDLRVIVSSDDHHATEEILDGVSVCRAPTRLTFAATPLSPAMVSRMRTDDADIVHIHLPNPMAVLAYLASGHRGRLVITYHSDTVRQTILGPMFEPFLHAVLRRSSAIIVASPNYLRTSPALSRYQDRCHVIPFGIALEEFSHCDDNAVAAIRRKYGDRLILSVGRLVYYKGFEHLIRSMTRVRANLLIVGDGPLRGKLTTLATEIGVADRVHFVGKIDQNELVASYHAADVFALASVERSEAFGIVQIEAMATGTPVVNTSLDSGVPFVSLDGVSGLTVPPGDSEALAAALNRLLDNQPLRRSLGNGARVRARQEFSREAMTSRTMALYDTVMGRRRAMAATR